MKVKLIGGTVAILGLGALLVACATGADKDPNSVSGYTFAIPETQAMWDDDFNNPGMLWVGIGEDNWAAKEGSKGKSCAECHGKAEKSMKGVGAKYPIYDKKTKKPLVMEARINRCRTENMGAKAWKWESDEMMGMTGYVKYQSRGMPIVADSDDKSSPLHSSWQKGKEFFFQRRGQMDMACSNCHEDYAGVKIRANTLTQGQVNGFPTYRLKWQKPGTIHRRYIGCNKMIRATPFKRGSDEYTDLEVYMTWRSRGLPIETPAVRN